MCLNYATPTSFFPYQPPVIRRTASVLWWWPGADAVRMEGAQRAKLLASFLKSIHNKAIAHRRRHPLHGSPLARKSRLLSASDVVQGPNLQNILRQSYDHLTIMPKLRSTYDGRLIYKTSYKGRKAFLGTIHLQSCKIVWDSVRKLAYDIPKRNFSTF